MKHQHKIGGNNVEISWGMYKSEQPRCNLKLLLLRNRPGKHQSSIVESVSPKPILEKWQKVPLSPL